MSDHKNPLDKDYMKLLLESEELSSHILMVKAIISQRAHLGFEYWQRLFLEINKHKAQLEQPVLEKSTMSNGYDGPVYPKFKNMEEVYHLLKYGFDFNDKTEQVSNVFKDAPPIISLKLPNVNVCNFQVNHDFITTSLEANFLKRVKKSDSSIELGVVKNIRALNGQSEDYRYGFMVWKNDSYIEKLIKTPFTEFVGLKIQNLQNFNLYRKVPVDEKEGAPLIEVPPLFSSVEEFKKNFLNFNLATNQKIEDVLVKTVNNLKEIEYPDKSRVKRIESSIEHEHPEPFWLETKDNKVTKSIFNLVLEEEKPTKKWTSIIKEEDTEKTIIEQVDKSLNINMQKIWQPLSDLKTYESLNHDRLPERRREHLFEQYETNNVPKYDFSFIKKSKDNFDEQQMMPEEVSHKITLQDYLGELHRKFFLAEIEKVKERLPDSFQELIKGKSSYSERLPFLSENEFNQFISSYFLINDDNDLYMRLRAFYKLATLHRYSVMRNYEKFSHIWREEENRIDIITRFAQKDLNYEEIARQNINFRSDTNKESPLLKKVMLIKENDLEEITVYQYMINYLKNTGKELYKTFEPLIKTNQTMELHNYYPLKEIEGDCYIKPLKKDLNFFQNLVEKLDRYLYPWRHWVEYTELPRKTFFQNSSDIQTYDPDLDVCIHQSGLLAKKRTTEIISDLEYKNFSNLRSNYQKSKSNIEIINQKLAINEKATNSNDFDLNIAYIFDADRILSHIKKFEDNTLIENISNSLENNLSFLNEKVKNTELLDYHKVFDYSYEETYQLFFWKHENPYMPQFSYINELLFNDEDQLFYLADSNKKYAILTPDTWETTVSGLLDWQQVPSWKIPDRISGDIFNENLKNKWLDYITWHNSKYSFKIRTKEDFDLFFSKLHKVFGYVWRTDFFDNATIDLEYFKNYDNLYNLRESHRRLFSDLELNEHFVDTRRIPHWVFEASSCSEFFDDLLMDMSIWGDLREHFEMNDTSHIIRDFAWEDFDVECDFANSWQFGFQDPATPIMEGIIDIHHHIFFFLTVIFVFVSWMILRIMMHYHYRFKYKNKYGVLSKFKKSSFYTQEIVSLEKTELFKKAIPNKHFANLKQVAFIKFEHHTLLEIIWTIIPSLILLAIAVPSFILLYSMDEIIDPSITIKAVGHQWYWSYEYSDYKVEFDDIEFDSYMIPDEELEIGQLRLLEVDNPVVLPVNTHIRVILTSNDVLHSWAVPSLGVKTDCVPGRLNQVSIFLKRLGTFYGQCSEICGVNHGFMPIVVKSVTLDQYLSWLTNKL